MEISPWNGVWARRPVHGACLARILVCVVAAGLCCGCDASSRQAAPPPANQADEAAALAPRDESPTPEQAEADLKLSEDLGPEGDRGGDLDAAADAEPADAEPGGTIGGAAAGTAPQPPLKLPAAEAPLPLDHVATVDLTMPKVSLTEHHGGLCKVKVGDSFPALRLKDLAGHEQTLSELQGERLTLVVFWNGAQPTALEELADLARFHQPRFASEGLSIVAINSGDSPELAGELARQAAADFPVLCDTDGQAFARVATTRLPRSYLLNRSGEVLWFDLEYSPTTRRDLVQAIRFQLAHE